jgi:tetratricopeptide (TPR) repeat protein
MGVVYIGYDRQWREVFAAKTFQREVFARSPDVADRFVREALAWVSLDVHPHIAEARRVEEVDGRPLLFLEYVSGGDLASWIGSPRLLRSLRRVLALALQFCDGMTHATGKGIVAHRDVKPSNCLVTEDGDLKITDFGLAKVALLPTEATGSGPGGTAAGVDETLDLPGADAASRTGRASGTPAYMPPEQFADVKHVDLRADVYAFGVMMFEMITGARPFTGRTVADLARQHRMEPAPRLQNVPVNVADVVATCLAKEPAARFQDFAALRAALAAAYLEETGEAPPDPVAGAALDAARLNNKGLSLMKLGRAAEALEVFEASLRLDGRSVRAWANKAAALGERLGRWDEALACTENALSIDPRDAAAWTNHGMALRAQGRTTEALECQEHALALEPTSPAPWSNKAVALHALGHPREALSAVDESLAIDATAAPTWSNKSLILRSLGRPDEGLACDDKAVELDEADERLWLNRSATLLALRRPEEALASADRALSLQPRLARAWLNKGVALRTLGRDDDALVCYQRAVDLDATYGMAWSNLGNALFAAGRSDEALVCFDRAIALDAQHGMAWLNKGVVLLHSDDLPGAAKCLEAAERAGVAQAGALLSRIRAKS